MSDMNHRHEEIRVLAPPFHAADACHPGAANPLSARILLFFCRNAVPFLGKLYRTFLHCDIYCDLRGRTVIMPHPYGIIVHSKARIGDRVVIMQQVTIGIRGHGVNEAPVIEDEVYIGAGAKVLGGIRVGHGAVIGANAVVTRDVPPRATVVGSNRIVRRSP
jgi:serine O-acetyltransferase